MIKIKTNEQEIKELETELKKIDEQLDELRPLCDEYNGMLRAIDAYSELNIDAAYIESSLEMLKAAQQENEVLSDTAGGSTIANEESSCIAPDPTEPYTREELMDLDKSELAEIILVRQYLIEDTATIFDGVETPEDPSVTMDEVEIDTGWDYFNPVEVAVKTDRLHGEALIRLDKIDFNDPECAKEAKAISDLLLHIELNMRSFYLYHEEMDKIKDANEETSQGGDEPCDTRSIDAAEKQEAFHQIDEHLHDENNCRE